jgi:hypothetical protein
MRLRFAIRNLLVPTFVAGTTFVVAAISPAAYVLADDTPAPNTAALKGRFLYDGPAPEPQVITPTKDKQAFSNYRIIDESLLVPRILGIQNIFIWVRGKDIPVPAPGKLDPVTVEFKEGRFSPHALAFQVPRELILKNGEPAIACNIKGDLSNNPGFNHLLPMQQQISVRIRQSETTPTRLQDNLHPWAQSWILPLSHPYFSVTNEGGEFKIESLLPGTWEFQVWHERTGNLETADWKRGRFSLEIKPGENDLGVIKLDPKTFDSR